MNKKYVYLLLLSSLITACSGGDGPDMPNPTPNPDETVKPDGGENKPEGGIKTCVFPTDFTDELLGQEVKIKNQLTVVRTFGDRLSENLTLSPNLLRIPTDHLLPGSSEFEEAERENQVNKLTLNPTKFSLLDPTTQTLRVGSKVTELQGKISKDRGRYVLTLTAQPKIDFASRPTLNLKQGGIRVASMNLEYYMASPSKWGHSNGAQSKEEFIRQNAKIVAALKEINADIYAICEIEEGDYSPAYLTEQLNQALGTTKYKNIDTGDKEISSYTKNTFIYNSEVVKPYKDCKTYNSNYLTLRHINQCFQSVKDQEKFILSVNHFKAKTGKNPSGSDADQHDGQGQYNSKRVKEAQNCLNTFAELTSYYDDPDILVVGDLNSYSKEDPVRLFTDAGYTDELMKYSPATWSYLYDGQAGYLDHILSSSTMTQQVIDATSWDVNASEPSGIGYRNSNYSQNDWYRYSDHNPVIAILNLK